MAGAMLAAFVAGVALGAGLCRREQGRAAASSDVPDRAAAGSGAGRLGSMALGGPVDLWIRIGDELDEASFLRHMARTEADNESAVLGGSVVGYRPTTRERQERRARLYGD